MIHHPRTERDPFFDNAKFLLMLVVVTGHLLGPIAPKEAWVRGLYVFIHLFHIPMFVGIAGHFSRRSTGPEAMKKNLNRLLAPYLIFQGLSLAMSHFVLGKDVSAAQFILRPYFALWFLVSLFTWRMALPLLARIPGAFAVSLALGPLSGCIPWLGRTLSLARTFSFLPFFMAGYALQNRGWRQSLRHLRVPLLAVLAGGAAASFLWTSLPQKWLFGCYSYQSLGHSGWEGAAIRLALYGANFALGLAFLAWVPERKTFFTEWGSRSLYVYLLHVPVFKIIKAAGCYGLVTSPLAELAVVATAILLTCALSTRLIPSLFRFLVEPRWIK